MRMGGRSVRRASVRHATSHLQSDGDHKAGAGEPIESPPHTPSQTWISESSHKSLRASSAARSSGANSSFKIPSTSAFLRRTRALLIREAQGPYLDRADASHELPSDSQSGPYSTLSRPAQVGNTGRTSQALPRPVRRLRMSGRRPRRSPDRNGHTEPAEG